MNKIRYVLVTLLLGVLALVLVLSTGEKATDCTGPPRLKRLIEDPEKGPLLGGRAYLASNAHGGVSLHLARALFPKMLYTALSQCAIVEGVEGPEVVQIDWFLQIAADDSFEAMADSVQNEDDIEVTKLASSRARLSYGLAILCKALALSPNFRGWTDLYAMEQIQDCTATRNMQSEHDQALPLLLAARRVLASVDGEPNDRCFLCARLVLAYVYWHCLIQPEKALAVYGEVLSWNPSVVTKVGVFYNQAEVCALIGDKTREKLAWLKLVALGEDIVGSRLWADAHKRLCDLER